jgi:hypothetical protein
LNRRVQSTRPLNPESHHDPNPANGRAALTRTGWLAEAWDGKPISDAEECPITAGNGANTGLAAYLGLGGVEVCPPTNLPCSHVLRDIFPPSPAPSSIFQPLGRRETQ